MIFATVGSHPTFAFERLLRGLEGLGAVDELVVQHGPGRPPANATTAMPWMTFDGVVEHLGRAEKVVSHAGTGSILLAREAGQTPVVVPRLKVHGETVDDHQLDLARALAGSGGIIVVEDASAIAAAVADAPARGEAPAPESAERLVAAVRGELHP